MLFIFAFTFSVGVNAATLKLTTEDVGFASQEVYAPNGNTVSGGGEVSSEGTDKWFSQFNLKSDRDTYVHIKWTFDSESDLTGARLGFTSLTDFPTYTTDIDITGNYSFSVLLIEGVSYALDILDASGNKLEYKVSVSAVPVPAALFLFAPALLGFLGLRRKSAVDA